ncbi:DNA/RNA polymerases superfamily protein [Gossypium australe]|uniref:DNA/RNA polymerases superfamily protein n=1 Tax=Gossypium australe TaxID=47621 RepID=A0A5B6WFI8_9ROSI|nr:DNA/RNA polymerases superfamily protein [Gossypium australe]
MRPNKALYGHKCQTPLFWSNLNKVRAIRDFLKATPDRKKSYANLKRKYIEFKIDDKVFLKVSPWKKVLKGKLSLRFIRPYEIFKRIGPVKCEFEDMWH